MAGPGASLPILTWLPSHLVILNQGQVNSARIPDPAGRGRLALSLIYFRLVKHFTNVSVSAKMRLTSKGTCQNPLRGVQNPIKSRSTGRQNYENRVQNRLAHLNI
jgi:hypothetical protein